MVLPSGEKATEGTRLLCACFCALRSRDAAAGRRVVSFGLRVQGYQSRGTCIPDFEVRAPRLIGSLVARGPRGLVVSLLWLVARARHDGLAIGGEGHGVHKVAVGVLLLRLELQRCCRKHRSCQIWVEGWRACQRRRTCIPDFDRLVARARDDGLAVGREDHRGHGPAVRFLFLRLELQGCQGRCCRRLFSTSGRRLFSWRLTQRKGAAHRAAVPLQRSRVRCGMRVRALASGGTSSGRHGNLHTRAWGC